MKYLVTVCTCHLRVFTPFFFDPVKFRYVATDAVTDNEWLDFYIIDALLRHFGLYDLCSRCLFWLDTFSAFCHSGPLPNTSRPDPYKEQTH